MKRLFAFLLALAMVLSLGVTVFAAEGTGSITVTNATYGETYAIYHIFDASIKYKTENGEQVLVDGKPVVDGVAYTIDRENNQFFSALFVKETADDGTVTYNNTFFDYNPNTGSVTKKEGVNDSELIKYLTNLVANGNYETATKSILAVEKGKTQNDYNLDYTFSAVTHITDEGPEIAFENLSYGYYLITSTLGTTATINSNTPNVEVIDKNQEPGTNFDKKVQVGEDEDGNPIWADANSANIGDKITYQISFEATNYDGDKLIKHYQIHDEKGDAIWAEFNSFTVKVGGDELPRGYYLSQGGANTDNWEYLGDWGTTEKDRDNAQWYLVHLGYDKFRITIPWLKDHTLTDVTDDSGNVVSYTLTYPANAASKYDSPAEVEITYDATIEPSASIGATTHGNRFNKASASWTSEYETGTTPPDEVVTHVYGIGLLKDDTANGQNLEGAKFKVWKNYDANTKVYSGEVWLIPTDIKGVYMVDSLDTYADVGMSGTERELARTYYKNLYAQKGMDYDTVRNAYLVDDKGNTVEKNNLVVSQVNGKLAILGLEAGTYYLQEVEAPDGYNALTTPVEIKAGEGTRSFIIFADTAGNVADIQQTDGVHTEKTYDLTHTVVHNSKGTELPSTGGEGAFMLISIGTMIAIGFAVLMITQKKMSVYRD